VTRITVELPSIRKGQARGPARASTIATREKLTEFLKANCSRPASLYNRGNAMAFGKRSTKEINDIGVPTG
jgi:hypothetical protein